MCPYDIGPVGQMLTVKFIVPDEPLIMGDIGGIDVSFVILDDCSCLLLADEGIIDVLSSAFLGSFTFLISALKSSAF